MDKSKKYVLIALGLLLILGVFVFDQPQVGAQATKPPQQVQVMNAAGTAPGQNVPISGNVGITGTPSVNATQNGAWTVGVNNQPNVTAFKGGTWNVGIDGQVTLANSALNPLHVLDFDRVREPFQESVNVPIPNGAFTPEGVILTVPAGRRAVIEYASFHLALPTTQKVLEVHVTTNVGGFFRQNFLVPYALGLGFGGRDWFVAAQQVRLFADPGTNILVGLFRNPSTDPSAFRATISGYLVPAP